LNHLSYSNVPYHFGMRINMGIEWWSFCCSRTIGRSRSAGRFILAKNILKTPFCSFLCTKIYQKTGWATCWPIFRCHWVTLFWTQNILKLEMSQLQQWSSSSMKLVEWYALFSKKARLRNFCWGKNWFFDFLVKTNTENAAKALNWFFLRENWFLIFWSKQIQKMLPWI
jgi:hypothetical protein